MRWACGIIAVFVVLIGVNALLVFFAISSEKGLIEQRPYERGLAYQEVLDQLVRAEQSGWRPRFQLSRSDGQGNRLLEVSLLSADGTPVSGLAASVRAQYPAKAKVDSSAQLKEGSPGQYAASLPMEPHGRWLLQLEVKQDDLLLLWKTNIVAPK